jgi:hypothetical protein
LFVADLKVLPLPYYDMIVGIDWLEAHSPMKIDWLNKWVILNCAGSAVQLHGMQPSLPEFSLVELVLVTDKDELMDHSCMAQIPLPEPIQELLHQYDHLFAEPQDLPPSRVCNHTIPLIAGAQPINIRPYRFSPAMKDEIEN